MKILELNQRYFLDFFIVLLLAIVLFSWLQAAPTLPEPDSFYHAKMAVILGQGHILQQFPWLTETNLPESFIDNHFLYHLFLAPFVKFFNPLAGVKIATVFLASLAAGIIYWLFKKFQIKWPFLFIIILLSSQPWLFRAGLVKAPVGMLSILVIGFYLAAHQRYKILALVSFLAVWFYAGWPLLPFLIFIYVFAVWFLEKLKKQESIWHKIKDIIKVSRGQVIPWPALGYCAAGIALGIVVNPYFPNNLFNYLQLFRMGVINYQSVIGVGGEWYPYGYVNLIKDAPMACSLLVMGIFIFILTYKKQSSYSWAWGILLMIFLALTLKSRRNVEFFIPAAVIFSGFAFSDFIKRLSFLEKKMLDKTIWQKIIIVLLLAIGLGFFFNLPNDLKSAKRDMANGWALTHYQKAAFWLKNNTPKGSIVFNADWDDFTFLFYHNSHNYYLTGLDPSFMYEKSHDRYWRYVDITLGKRKDDLKKIINGDFGADYVFMDNQHQALENNLKASPYFSLVYRDEEAKVFKVIN